MKHKTYHYPSDITREQFSKIESDLASARKQTRPRTYDLYDIFNALSYVLKTVCQWRALPSDYPKWRTVHEYFCIWSEEREGQENTILDRVLKKSGGTRAYKQWKKQYDQLHYYRRSEC
jgi:transposase